MKTKIIFVALIIWSSSSSSSWQPKVWEFCLRLSAYLRSQLSHCNTLSHPHCALSISVLSVFLFALRLPLGLSCSLYSLGAVYFVFLFSFVCILQLLVLHNTQKALSYCSLDAKVDGLFYCILFNFPQLTFTVLHLKLVSTIPTGFQAYGWPAQSNKTSQLWYHNNNSRAQKQPARWRV